MIIEQLRSFAPRSLLRPVAGRDHIQGPISAPFTLVEYGDFECPYCGLAYPIIKATLKELRGRANFAFRHFPLIHIHGNAQHAAEAAEAAAAQGRFWEMHDILFENQNALEDEDIALHAAALGLNARRLVQETLSRCHATRVREDFQSGARSGVDGAPAIFVNGRRFGGTLDVDSLIAELTRTAVYERSTQGAEVWAH